MASRYSDRFFGPQGPPGRDAPPPGGQDTGPQPAVEPRPSPVGSHAVRADEIDLVGGSEPSPPGDPAYGSMPPGRPWHQNGLARASLVGALVAGVILGAYGWDEWRDRQAESIAQSVVDVASDVSLLTFNPDSNHTSLSVRLHNEGPHAITITGFTPVDPRMSSTDKPFEPVDIAVAEDFVEVLNFGLDCSVQVEAGSKDTDTPVIAHIRTMDGVDHEQTLRLTGSVLGYGGGVTEQCSYYQPAGSFESLYPEVSTAETVGDTVVVEVKFYNDGGRAAVEPVIDSIEAPSLAFDARWDGSYGSTGDATIIQIVWSIEECENALKADDMDMLANIKGALPDDAAPTTTSAYPSTSLITQLVRLSERVCR